MALKASEREHINKLGKKFVAAHTAATMSVLKNPKMVAMDKIRMHLTIKVALKATGYPGIDGFVVPPECRHAAKVSAGARMSHITDNCIAFIIAVREWVLALLIAAGVVAMLSYIAPVIEGLKYVPPGYPL